MMSEELNLDGVLSGRIRIKEQINQFEPVIQEIFYSAYGLELEALPEQLNSEISMEYILDLLLDLKTRDQKLILMRLGVATGVPMTLEEIADVFGITTGRAKFIESKFLRRASLPLKKRKKLADFLEE